MFDRVFSCPVDAKDNKELSLGGFGAPFSFFFKKKMRLHELCVVKRHGVKAKIRIV
jgi:hypothetical protein